MTILFEGKEYSSDNLQPLYARALFFAEGIDFLHQLINDQLSFSFKSSGTTKISKDISVSRQQIKASVESTVDFLGIHGTDTALVCLSAEFVATKMMIARCYFNNMDLVLTRPSSNPLAQLPSEVEINFSSFVPYQVETILKSKDRDRLERINHILIGGAPISLILEKLLKNLSNNVYHTYGMTETVSHIALRKVSGFSNSPYFECLPGVKISCNKDNCLIVNAPQTDHMDVHTSDIVEISANDQFRWLGRNDNVINSGGIKIIPEEIEEFLRPKLMNLNIQNDFFIFGLKDDTLGEKLILVIEDSQLPSNVEYELFQSISQRFSKYHVPKDTVVAKDFVRTAAGKVRRTETISLIY